jgi:hypothetical protein
MKIQVYRIERLALPISDLLNLYCISSLQILKQVQDDTFFKNFVRISIFGALTYKGRGEEKYNGLSYLFWKERIRLYSCKF